jgi:hypothetical protein
MFLDRQVPDRNDGSAASPCGQRAVGRIGGSQVRQRLVSPVAGDGEVPFIALRSSSSSCSAPAIAIPSLRAEPQSALSGFDPRYSCAIPWIPTTRAINVPLVYNSCVFGSRCPAARKHMIWDVRLTLLVGMPLGLDGVVLIGALVPKEPWPPAPVPLSPPPVLRVMS